MNPFFPLIQAALDYGAARAALVEAPQIMLSASFRAICEGNGCGNFNRCWMCPPHIGAIEPLMAQVRRFSHGLLYQSVANIEDSFDIEGMLAAGHLHAQLSQQVQATLRDLLPGESLHLTCGGCRLCERCAQQDNLPCRHPDKALPSLEGYGVDVYNTARNVGLPYINGQNTVTYFGMVLFSEV